MSLLSKEDVVCQVLHDLCYDHQTPTDDTTVISGDLDINKLGGNNGRRNEAVQNLEQFSGIKSMH